MRDGDSFKNTKRKDIDWALCCLCQGKSNKELRCPYKKECYHNAHHTLEDDLKNFVVNDAPLSLGVNFACLDNEAGIANTLLESKAKITMNVEDALAHTLYNREEQWRDFES